MTKEQSKKILKRIVEIEADITELNRVLVDILKNGFASGTISSNGVSKSYTRADTAKINETIAILTKELKGYRKLLSGSNIVSPRQIYTIYC